MADNLLSRVEILLDANTARFESGFARAERVADQSSRNMAGGLSRVTVSAKQTESQVDNLGRSLSKHEVEVAKVAKSYNLMHSAAKIAIAGFSVSEVINIADGYGQMAAQIQNATKDQQEYNKVQKHLLETANTTYRALAEAQQVYLDVGGALKAYNETTERSLRITDSLSFSYTHNATAADKAKSSTDAFTKSIYEGKVSGDSWRAMLSAIPSIVDDLARSTGKSKAEILSLGNAGKVSLDELKKGLDENRESSEALANAMRNSVADGKVAFGNAFSKIVGEANIAYDVTNKMAGGLGLLADNLETVVDVGMVGAAFYAGTYIPAVYASVTAGYTKAKQVAEQTAVQYAAVQAERSAAAQEVINIEAKLASAQATRVQIIEELKLELRRMKAQISTQGSINSEIRMGVLRQQQAAVNAELTATENALAVARARSNAAATTSMGVGRGLLGVLGGPVGLGIAVASVAAGYLMMRDTTNSATEALNVQDVEVDSIVEKYRELDDLQRRTTMREVEKKVTKLTNSYTASYAALSGYVESLENSGSVSEKTARQMTSLLGQYSRGEIDAVAFTNSINNLGGVQEKHKVKIDDLTTAQRQSKVEYERIKKIQSELTSQTKNAINANYDEAKSIDAKREAQQKLNTEQQSAYDKLKEQLDREAYIQKNMKDMGWSRQRAEYAADVRISSKMGYFGGAMPTQLAQMTEAGWKLQQQTEARKKSEQETTKELEKQYKYSNLELKMLQRVTALSAKYDLDGIGAKYGVPKNYLAGLMAQESGGNPNAVSPTGAIGYFQTTVDYRKDNKISIADSKNLPVIANVVAKNLAAAYQKLGSWEAAIRSHNAGVAGSAQFGRTGRVTGGDARNKEVANFAPSVNKWIVGLGGSSLKSKGMTDGVSDLKDYYDFEKEKAKLQKQLQLDLANDVTKIRENLKDKLIELDKAGFSDEEAKRLTDEYTAVAENDIAIAEQALKTKVDSYSEYLKSEEDLLKDSYAERQFNVLHDLELTKAQREQAVSHLQQQMQYEIDAVRRKENEQVQSAFEAYMNETQIVLKRYAVEREEIQKNYRLSKEIREKLLQANAMGVDGVLIKNNQAVDSIYGQSLDYVFRKNEPQKAARYDLDNQRAEAWGSLESKYSEQRGGIFQAVEDEKQRSELLLAAHEQFLQAKSALEDEYDQRSTDLAQSQHVQQLQLWGSLTSQAQNTWSQMTQAVKDGAGEQSAAYKAAFLAQQVFAIASTLISAHVAATQAAADPSNITMIGKLSASQAMLAMGYANAALIGAQTFAGFADGGYTGAGSKYEYAGPVHKGEIVFSQADIERLGGVAAVESIRTSTGFADGGYTGGFDVERSFESNRNNDLAKALASADKSDGGQTINIFTLPGQTADISTNEDGSLDVRVRQIVEEEFERGVSNGNSRISKAIQQNLNAGRRYG